jgi:hypothetical protein
MTQSTQQYPGPWRVVALASVGNAAATVRDSIAAAAVAATILATCRIPTAPLIVVPPMGGARHGIVLTFLLLLAD